MESNYTEIVKQTLLLIAIVQTDKKKGEKKEDNRRSLLTAYTADVIMKATTNFNGNEEKAAANKTCHIKIKYDHISFFIVNSMCVE